MLVRTFGWACCVTAALAPLPAQRTSTPVPSTPRPDPIVQRAIARTLDRLQSAAAQTDLYVDHSTWADPWIVKTDHFEVRTTASYAYGLDLASALELRLVDLQQALQTEHAPDTRFAIHLFPTLAEYNEYGNATSQSADEHSSFYGSFYAGQDPGQPVIAVFDANPLWVKMQVTHSFVHQWLASAFPGQAIPTWIDEGLASYLAMFWSYEWGVDQIAAMKEAGNLAGARQLLRAPIAQYSAARFTELGMLYYYLLRFREDTRTTLPSETPQRAPFRDYLLDVLSGREPRQSAATELLSDPSALERDFAAFEFPR